MANNPLIGWKNLLAFGNDPTVTTGTDSTSNPITNVTNGFMTRPALPIADGSGTVVVEFTGLNSGFGSFGFGEEGFGLSPFGGVFTADLFIIGAARNNSAGEHFTGGNVKLELYDSVSAAWTTVVDTAMPATANVSQRFLLDPLTGAATSARLTITGQTANSSVRLPELYLGPAITMPFLDLGFDPYIEVSKGNRVDVSTGRTLRNVRFRRIEVDPSWSNLERATWEEVDLFREDVIEEAGKFWWLWAPESAPAAVYLVQHDKESAPMPYKSATLRTFRLKLVEAL